MKYTNLRAFEKHLQGSAPLHFSPIYLIQAKEEGERKNALSKLIFFLKKGCNHPDAGLKTFDGEQIAVESLLNELNTLSFFSQRQTIIVYLGEKVKKPLTEALEQYFQKPNRAISLVLSSPGVSPNSSFYKKAEKEGIILDIPEEKPWEKEKTFQEWIIQYFSENGKSITPQVSQLLFKSIGPERLLLEQEMEKLICYVGARVEISSQDVKLLTCGVNLENAWQLGEAIFKGDIASALRISKALMNDGTHFIMLLKQIRSQFQTDFQVSSILSQGGTQEEVAKAFPYMKGQILTKHIQFAQRYGISRFRKGLLLIEEAETAAKNSAVDVEFLCEILLIKLTN